MTSIAVKDDGPPLGAVLLYALTALGTLGALMATAFSDDRLFRLHGWVFVAAGLAASTVMTVGLNSGRFQ